MSSLMWQLCLVILTLRATYTNGWTWTCDKNTGLCKRQATPDTAEYVIVDNGKVISDKYPSIEVCRLTCGRFRSLWPQPTGVTRFGNTLMHFEMSKMTITVNATEEVKALVNEMTEIFELNLMPERTKDCIAETAVNVEITVTSPQMYLDLHTDEGYTLQLGTIDGVVYVKISASTAFGARHALESLSQLIEPYPNSDGSVCFVMLSEASFMDSPVFSHRGLLLDSSRNYLPLKNILKHVDAMSASKMNVLHWHVTDSQSWPLEIPSIPNMTKYGAYSKDKIYTPDDVRYLVNYAMLRGVRILPEIDAPSHSGNGWQWGEDAGLGPLAVCVNKGPFRSYCIEPPCGQLNPANPNLYDVLEKLYEDVNGLFKSDMFHMGGDELFFPCWNSSEPILHYINNKPRTMETFLGLWSEFQENALTKFELSRAQPNTPVILWNSHLTDPSIIEKYLSKERYIIQTWVPQSDELPERLLELGYNLIMSTKDAWYLDHGFWGNTPYYDWMKVYKNTILRSEQVLGGEVCMWGEYVDETGVESRVWPRAAAAAERLWADPATNFVEVTPRFLRHRQRLVDRGIRADAASPRWCYQNEGACR